MAKFYRVIKDHPMWEVGAIVSDEEGPGYRPISDLFVKDIGDVDDSWHEGEDLVENQPEWFERVYEHKLVGHKLVGKVKYLAKAEAKKLFQEQYK